MADTTAPAPNPNALDVTGSAELASSWLLENDWRELQAGAQQAAAAAAGGHGAGADDDDDDDDDGDGDGDGGGGAPREPPAPAQGRHAGLRVRRRRGRDVLLPYRFVDRDGASSDRGAAERSLGDVWTHCVPEADPGYWLVPLQMGDLDDVWWKILEPHLIQKKFGSAVVLQTLAPKSGARGAGAARRRPSRAPAFDELEARAAEAARARAHAGPRYGGARAAAPDAASAVPEWHEKHADFRVKKTVDAPPAKPPGGLFAAHAQKRVKFDVERRTDDRASEWSPLDAK
ncbi:hypothetical protein JL720_3004 [Aureococcus anophagefferens]|nr:hypothetical protein JL720_3004 [Aureococcus anophagefferens]